MAARTVDAALHTEISKPGEAASVIININR